MLKLDVWHLKVEKKRKWEYKKCKLQG